MCFSLTSSISVQCNEVHVTDSKVSVHCLYMRRSQCLHHRYYTVTVQYNIYACIDHHQCGARSRSPQLSADHLMQGDLYSKVSFRTAVAGCYTRYRGDRLMQTISVQTDWESVRTVLMWPLC